MSGQPLVIRSIRFAGFLRFALGITLAGVLGSHAAVPAAASRETAGAATVGVALDPVLCVEVFPQVKIGSAKVNRKTGVSSQTVTIKNAGRTAIAGPLRFVLDGLPAGITLLNKTGDSDCLGTGPFMQLGLGGDDVLSPRESVTVTLQFSNPANVPISYTPLVSSSDAAAIDSDGDGVVDASDNCINVVNPNQEDGDADDVGDACDEDYVTVPDLTGLNQFDVLQQLASANLAGGTITHVEGPAAGTVNSQVPAPGSRVLKGTAVDLVVQFQRFRLNGLDIEWFDTPGSPDSAGKVSGTGSRVRAGAIEVSSNGPDHDVTAAAGDAAGSVALLCQGCTATPTTGGTAEPEFEMTTSPEGVIDATVLATGVSAACGDCTFTVRESTEGGRTLVGTTTGLSGLVEVTVSPDNACDDCLAIAVACEDCSVTIRDSPEDGGSTLVSTTIGLSGLVEATVSSNDGCEDCLGIAVLCEDCAVTATSPAGGVEMTTDTGGTIDALADGTGFSLACFACNAEANSSEGSTQLAATGDERLTATVTVGAVSLACIGCDAGPPPPDPLNCQTSGPLNLVVGDSLAISAACDGTGPFTVAEASGSFVNGAGVGACSGLTVATTSVGFVFSGAPVNVGSCAADLTITDSSSPPRASAFVQNFTIYEPLQVSSAATLPPGDVNTSFDRTFGIQTSGGSGGYTVVVTSTVPAGISFDEELQSLTGVPAAGGSFSVTFEVRDTLLSSQVVVRSPSFVIYEIATTTLPGGRVGEPYDASIATRGGVAGFMDVVDPENLPPGVWSISLSNPVSSLAVFGSPTQAGTFTFTARVRTADGGALDTQSLTVVIDDVEPPPDLVTVPDLTGLVHYDALNRLDQGNLILGTITTVLGLQAGFITAQSPLPDVLVPAGTPVDITETYQQYDFDGFTVRCYELPCLLGGDRITSGGGRLVVGDVTVSCLSPGCPLIAHVPNGDAAAVECRDCQYQFGGGPPQAADDPDVEIFIVRPLVQPRATALIRKQVVNAAGEPDPSANAEFRYDLDVSYSVRLRTVNGQGTAIIDLPASGPGFPFMFESVPVGWELVSRQCDVDTLIPGQPYDLPPGTTVTWTYVNRKLPVGENRPLGVTGPEADTTSDTFGLPPGNRIVIAGGNGFEFRDAVTDQIPTAGNTLLSFVNQGTPYQNLYGAIVARNPLGNGADALFTHGSGGTSVRQFFPDTGTFGATQVSILPANVTDEVRFGGAIDAAGILWTNFTGTKVRAHVWQDLGGWFFNEVQTDLVNTLGVGVQTGMVSAFAYDLRFASNGTLLADSPGWVATVLDGTPGELWISNPQTLFDVGTLIGSVGESPRRIRCLPSTQICAVSNFGSDSLTIVRWDGRSTASITGTAVIGDGPVGIDLRADGVNTLIISTGFNDHTFSVTTIDANGSILSSVPQAVPTGCVNPGHAVWLPNQPGTAAITCKGSNSYAVVTP